jgi:hypothetical protein
MAEDDQGHEPRINEIPAGSKAKCQRIHRFKKHQQRSRLAPPLGRSAALPIRVAAFDLLRTAPWFRAKRRYCRSNMSLTRAARSA